MDHLSIIWAYMPNILKGAVLTLEIALISFVLAVLVGFVGALMRLSSNPILFGVSTAYSSLVRSIPDIIWMFICYYSVQIGLNQITDYLGHDTIEISAYGAGIVSLTFIFGAFCTETIRGALLAVPAGQIEAAQAYGLRPLVIAYRIKFPLMMRNALPGLKNNWFVLTKATALVSIIGLDDMTKIAQGAGSSTGLSFTFNLISACLFLVLTGVSLKVYSVIERHYERGYSRESLDV